MDSFIRIAFWLASIVLAVLSLMPAEQLPANAFAVWDKAQHAIGFALLGALGLQGYRAHAFRVIGGLLVFGAMIEWAQDATGWRQGDWQDGLANALGLTMVWGLHAMRSWRQAQLSASPATPSVDDDRK